MDKPFYVPPQTSCLNRKYITQKQNVFFIYFKRSGYFLLESKTNTCTKNIILSSVTSVNGANNKLPKLIILFCLSHLLKNDLLHIRDAL